MKTKQIMPAKVNKCLGTTIVRSFYLPMKTKKKAKLALKAGTCKPAGFPGLPIIMAATSGSVTYAP